jgi:hypothetical protein
MIFSFEKSFISKTTILILSVVFFLCAIPAAAQKRFSKSYSAGKNVRLQLTNLKGTVTVEGWDGDTVSVSAYLESPAANIVPQVENGTIYINVVRDNQGRGEVGSVTFTIRVPYSSIVDVETRMGDLKVTSINGSLVRAHISTEGDISLINIYSSNVTAENGIGNIFYDGEIRPSGNYRFSSMRGDINLRIPFTSSFRLVATAPSTRSIELGDFRSSGMRYVSDGRRVVGQAGDGSATLNVTNQRGTISFIRR